ncbi:MAG TPA: polyprenyl synthetase family protein [Thermoleophilaceae bacterium]|nr:polyprenyl synthetase family protein [Thermoleophilaceae bacterium]
MGNGTGDGSLRQTAATPPFELPGPAAAELQQVETRLRAVATTCNKPVSDIVLHLVEAGGKRLRATLVISAALAVHARSVNERVIDAAVAVELLHLASLYHDDVLDDARQRRDRPTANALWGPHAAILTGDVLLAQAYRIAAELGTDELRRLSQTVTDLCAGQIAETATQFDAARDVSQYDASVRGKTAALVATCCWLGATAAGAPKRTAQTLSCFGLELGMAFQVIDDILDLYATADMVGKPVGGDVRTGVLTLPVLLALRADPSLADLLTQDIDDEGIDEVRNRVRDVGADRDAVGVATAHLQTALSHLGARGLAPAGKRLLVSIAHAIVDPLDQLGLSGGSGTVGGFSSEALPATS